jgi:hypothetical protein
MNSASSGPWGGTNAATVKSRPTFWRVATKKSRKLSGSQQWKWMLYSSDIRWSAVVSSSPGLAFITFVAQSR